MNMAENEGVKALQKQVDRRRFIKGAAGAALAAAGLAGRAEKTTAEIPNNLLPFESQNYLYSLMRPIDWQPLTAAGDDGKTVVDRFKALVPAKDKIVTTVDIFPQAAIPDKMLIDYYNDDFRPELEGKGGSGLGYSTQDKIDGLDAILIGAFMPNEDPTLPDYEQQMFLFLDKDKTNLWIARGKFSKDHGLDGNPEDVIRFFDMLTKYFHFKTS